MISDLEIWDAAAKPWSDKVTKPESLRSVHLLNGIKQLTGSVNGKTVLDAGCGDGVFTSYLKEQKANVVGIDGSPRMIEFARKKYPNLRFEVADLLKPLPFETGSFDLILANMVLMHLSDVNMFFQEAKRTLKTGGVVIFSILHPCFNYPTMRLHKSLWDKVLKRKPSGLAYDYFQQGTTRRYEKNLNQKLTHYHRTLEEYSKELELNGFVINSMLEPHLLTPEFLQANPKMEYTTRLPRFLFIKATNL